jgi:hypothetical protein
LVLITNRIDIMMAFVWRWSCHSTAELTTSLVDRSRHEHVNGFVKLPSAISKFTVRKNGRAWYFNWMVNCPLKWGFIWFLIGGAGPCTSTLNE